MVTNEQIQDLFSYIKENTEINSKIEIETEKPKLKNNKLGSQIAYYRKIKNISQKELAERIKASRKLIIEYEQNKKFKELNKKTEKIYKKIFKELDIEEKIQLDGYEKFILNGQANLLKNFIKKLGITQMVFSEMIGKSYEVTKGWIQGRSNMSRKAYKQIEKSLNEFNYSLID